MKNTDAMMAGVVTKCGKKQDERKIKGSYDPEFVGIAIRLLSVGFQTNDLAYTLGVSDRTLRRWKKSHPEFKEAFNKGKEGLVAYIAGKAVQQALGYDYDEITERFTITENGKRVKTGDVVVHKRQKGDSALAMYLLSNLDPKNWRMVRELRIENRNTLNLGDGKADIDKIGELARRVLEHYTSNYTGQFGVPQDTAVDDTKRRRIQARVLEDVQRMPSDSIQEPAVDIRPQESSGAEESAVHNAASAG